jgi:sensor c-di-GMP phosphodiesterase-like protein
VVHGLGAGLVQGYHFSKPLSAEDAMRYLAEQPSLRLIG